MQKSFYMALWAVLLAVSPGHAQDEAIAPILGAPSDLHDVAGHGETIFVELGARLHVEPNVRSAAIAMIDAPIELRVLGRHEHWVQVRYGSWKGWVATDDSTDAIRGGRTVPEHVAWRLALARELLVSRGRSARRQEVVPGAQTLGSFALLTDVEDRHLLRYLSRVASQLPKAYQDRYGLEIERMQRATRGPDADHSVDNAVILFAREDDYRTYESQVRPETDRGALGHAAYGLAVLFVGQQGPEDVAAVLVHELTHVLNHRVLASVPPPWLDEGMANDLAFCRIDGARRLVLGSLGGRSVVIEEHSYRPGGWIDFDQAIHLSGPVATRNQLRERWLAGGALRLETLVQLPSGHFFDPADRQVRYDVSTFFIRYLLDDENSDLASGFRSFLAALAASEAAGVQSLETYLGRNWESLESGFAERLENWRPSSE